MKKCRHVIVLSLFLLGLAGCDNSSKYHEFSESENRCVFRVSLDKNDGNEELKFQYIQALLMQKTFDVQDYEHKYIPKYEKTSKYIEFDMQKSCQEIVEMIVDQL